MLEPKWLRYPAIVRANEHTKNDLSMREVVALHIDVPRVR
jgi:hypothetical protein